MQNSGQSIEQRDAAKATIDLKEDIKKFIDASHGWQKSNQNLTYVIIAVALLQVIIGIIAIC